MKLYALAVGILLQIAGWSAVAFGGFIAWRQTSGTAGWIASYSGLGAFRPVIPAAIAAAGLVLLAFGVIVQLLARRS